jgi:hypothetical protein
MSGDRSLTYLKDMDIMEVMGKMGLIGLMGKPSPKIPNPISLLSP